jgi:hypothetical protein
MVRLPMQQTIEELLVHTKLISPPQLAVAQRDAEARNSPLAQTIIDLGFVTDRMFASWIADVTKLPVVDPLRADVVSEFQTYMPATIARQYEVVAIDVNADEMTIATVNPLDRACIEAVQAATGMKIQPVVAIHEQLAKLLEQFYPKEPEFDPSKTIAIPETDPFAYGDDTLLRMHSREYAFHNTPGDDSLGSETRVMKAGDAPQAAAPEVENAATAEASPPSQLDRIERALESLQRRVDAIDAALVQIINRKG